MLTMQTPPGSLIDYRIARCIGEENISTAIHQITAEEVRDGCSAWMLHSITQVGMQAVHKPSLQIESGGPEIHGRFFVVFLRWRMDGVEPDA